MNTRLSLGLLTAMILSACAPSEKQNPPPAASEPQKNTASQTANPAPAGEMKRVAITSITEHPALDLIRNGVIDQLKADGFEDGKNIKIDYQNAQGNPSTAAQIAKKFAGDNPDVIVAITTPSAQTVLAATKTIPVVFAGITDPIAAKLVTSWEPSGTNVTGTSNQHDMKPDVELMQAVVPELKSIGYVYSPSEANSVSTLQRLRDYVEPLGLKVVDVPAQRTTDILNAAYSLKGKVQVIYTANDNNVVASYSSMYKAANEMKIPLVASDIDSVSKGATAAIGVNEYKMGQDSGKMAVRILKGEAAGSIAPTRATEFELVVSKKHAQEQGVNLSEDLVKRAAKVLD